MVNKMSTKIVTYIETTETETVTDLLEKPIRLIYHGDQIQKIPSEKTLDISATITVRIKDIYIYGWG
jgi:hypothetical protein